MYICRYSHSLYRAGNDNYNRLNLFDDKKTAEQSVMPTHWLESVTIAIRVKEELKIALINIVYIMYISMYSDQQWDTL